MNWRRSRHLETRMQQRGLNCHQIEIALAHGREVGDSLVLTNANIDEMLQLRRQEIRDLERLRRKALTIIYDGGDAITAYRSVNVKRPRKH